MTTIFSRLKSDQFFKICLIDVDINRPDEKSVITYVASYYHTFARMKNEMKSGRRIANVIIFNDIFTENL